MASGVPRKGLADLQMLGRGMSGDACGAENTEFAGVSGMSGGSGSKKWLAGLRSFLVRAQKSVCGQQGLVCGQQGLVCGWQTVVAEVASLLLAALSISPDLNSSCKEDMGIGLYLSELRRSPRCSSCTPDNAQIYRILPRKTPVDLVQFIGFVPIYMHFRL